MPTYDVIVLGCGAMGSATLWHLSRRGVRCCGVEQFGIAHDRGSSHGDSRAIRKAYFEHPDYIPLLNRAYELWSELEVASGVTLKHEVGMVFAGVADSNAVRGLEHTYAVHALPHDRLDAAEAARRFPQFRFRDEHVVFYDPVGGYVEPELAITACIRLAEEAGATVLRHVAARSWSADGNGVTVIAGTETLHAGALVIAAGAWSSEVLRELKLPLRVLRKILVWYTSPDIASYNHGFPVWFIDQAYGAVYGFPAHNGHEMKLAVHSGGKEIADPTHLDRSLRPGDDAAIVRCLDETFPQLQMQRTRHAACMYTTTPDENFVLDVHPEHSHVAIAAGFSGHGFKFMPAIGEIMADLALAGTTNHAIDFLRLTRFAR